MATEKMWDDVIVILEMRKKIGICPVFYALQDYCKASGKGLGVLDLRFCEYNLGSVTPFACFFKDNNNYMVDILDLEEAKKQAIYKCGDMLIVPLDLGTNLRVIGTVEPDHVYPDNPAQCRGYNLSILEK